MTTVNYKAPIKDLQFQLEAFGYEEIAQLPVFEDYDLETAIEALTDASMILSEFWLPTNRKGDEEGVRFNPEDHSVTTPECFKEAYSSYAESG